MIKKLLIQNYALIEALELEFPSGLTIITGETGAGKSILLGALGLIMGNRADSRSLFDENKKCVVEAYFSIEKYGFNDTFFENNEIDYEDDLIIRRELTPAGKSRSFINDTPVNLKTLQDLSAELIDLHQQFDTSDIHDQNFQLKMVDALADNAHLLTKYRKEFREYAALKKQRDEIISMSQASQREIEFLNFQWDELDKAKLQLGEEDSLEEELTRLTHAEDIKRILGATFGQLEESETSILTQLSDIAQSLSQVRRFDDVVGRLYERLATSQIELRELSRDIENRYEAIEYDPDRLKTVQERLDMLNRLLNKHQVANVGELIKFRAQLASRLESFANRNMDIAAIEARISHLQNQLEQVAGVLNERRIAVIPSFEDKIHQRLSLLALENARLEVHCQSVEDLGPNGKDSVFFLFAANRGSRMLPIKDVASGGELSRLALVIKSLVASAIPLPTLIFDEIDAGISGDVALKMGNILRTLSNEHQVITITHSPQVAAKADTHYFVYKEEMPERTLTCVKSLDKEGRIFSIASMLSQNPPSAFAIENAKELLGL
ncbi:MAG: DNA repair protein RecN [Saprospiraceae bacterium]|nr:DNA repair protein RecN [Saprospiraceae bacterium]MDP4913052.1 DNA repair protein RecN [Saprospiraceae bacterium]